MRARWLWLLALAGCHRTQKPLPPVVDAAAASADASAPPPAPPPFRADLVDSIIFSPHGGLAFLYNSAKSTDFLVVDVRTGQKHAYLGELPRRSELGFDGRCDVSERGYMVNVDVWYAETDLTETFFVRDGKDQSFREDVVRGATLALPSQADVHDLFLTNAGESQKWVLPFSTTAVQTLAAGVVAVDSPKRMVLATLNADNIVVDNIEIPFPGTDSKVDYVDPDTGLLVVSQERKRCAFDLHAPTAAGVCLEYTPPDTFRHELARPDGKVFAWNSVVWGKTTKKHADDWARDTSADKCFLDIVNLAVGKAFKTQSPCAMTGERPLGYEDKTLVTDNSNIYRCSSNVTRRYDVTTGAFRGETKGPAFPEDVAPKQLAFMAKQPDQGLPNVMKASSFPTVYGLDATVWWSEGATVLARKAGNLLLCNKMSGTCGEALMPFAENDAAGASKDGRVFGVVTNGHFIALDGVTGAKKIDVAL